MGNSFKTLGAVWVGLLWGVACTGSTADTTDAGSSGSSGSTHASSQNAASSLAPSSVAASLPASAASSLAAPSSASPPSSQASASSMPAPQSSSHAPQGSSTVVASSATHPASSASPSTSTAPGQDPPLTGSDTTGPTCVTNSRWLLGDLKTAIMHPGRDCIACHATRGAVRFSTAGTVNASLHDEDDCQGVAGVTVRITNANGSQIEMTTNFNGNFDSQDTVVAPYQVVLIKGASQRRMVSHQSAGACMTCHTMDGSGGAPGRIVTP